MATEIVIKEITFSYEEVLAILLRKMEETSYSANKKRTVKLDVVPQKEQIKVTITLE